MEIACRRVTNEMAALLLDKALIATCMILAPSFCVMAWKADQRRDCRLPALWTTDADMFEGYTIVATSILLVSGMNWFVEVVLRVKVKGRPPRENRVRTMQL